MTTDQPKPSEQKPSEVLRPLYDALCDEQSWASPRVVASSREHVEKLYDYLDSNHAQLSDLAGVVRVQKEQIAGLERAVTVLMAPHANLNNPNVLFDHASVWCNQHLEMVPDDFGLPPPKPREEWPKWTKMFALGSGEQVIYRYDRDGTCSALHSSGIWGTCSATRDPKEVDVTHKEATQINPAIAKTHPLPIKLSDGRYAVITSASNYNAAGEAVPAKADPDPCPPHNWQRQPDASGNNDAHWTCRTCGARTDRRPGGGRQRSDGCTHDWERYPDPSGGSDSMWTCRRCGAETDKRPATDPSPTGDEAGEWAERAIAPFIDSHGNVLVTNGYSYWRITLLTSLTSHLTAYAAHRTREWTTWGVTEIAIRNPNVASYCNEWEARTLKAESALSAANRRVEELEAGSEIRRWQDAIRDMLMREIGQLPEDCRREIDGGGCDSGDPLDLTLSEIGQAVNSYEDTISFFKSASAAKDVEIKRLSDMVERLRFLVPAGVRWDEPAKPTTSEGKGVEG